MCLDTSPEETTYILKSILRLAGVPLENYSDALLHNDSPPVESADGIPPFHVVSINFSEVDKRNSSQSMDVYTGEMISHSSK